MVELLFEFGADVNLISQDGEHQTPLTISCSKRDEKTVKLLLDNGANPKIYFGYNIPIKYSILSKTYSCTKLLLDAGFSPNQIIDDNGMTAFHLACQTGYFKMVKLLYEYSANINSYTTGHWINNSFVDGYIYPIHFACQSGSLQCVQFLLQKGASLYTETYNEKSVIHFAAESGNIDLMRFLLLNGCNINESSYEKKTPQIYAQEHQNDKLNEYIK